MFLIIIITILFVIIVLSDVIILCPGINSIKLWSITIPTIIRFKITIPPAKTWLAAINNLGAKIWVLRVILFRNAWALIIERLTGAAYCWFGLADGCWHLSGGIAGEQPPLDTRFFLDSWLLQYTK